jgi:hypothetical protein
MTVHDVLREELDWARNEFREALEKNKDLEAALKRLIERGRELEAFERHVRQIQALAWGMIAVLAGTAALLLYAAFLD